MKHAAFVLAIVVGAILIGCEDNGIINPVADRESLGSQVSQSLSKNSDHPPCKGIPLIGLMREPGQFNSFIEINGTVEFSIETIERDPPFPRLWLQVDMILNAELKPFEYQEPVWNVFATTQDVVAIGGTEKSANLHKRYWIADMGENGMWLHITFSVSKSSIAVNSMWLQLPKIVRKYDVD